MCGWLKHLLKSLSLDQFDPDFVQSSLSWTHPCPRDHFTTEKLCCDVKKMWQRRLARHGTLLQHDESYDRLIVICLDYGVTLTVGHISCHSFTQGCDDEAEMCDETYEASPCHWWQNVVPIQETT